jgi:hypothetical protein
MNSYKNNNWNSAIKAKLVAYLTKHGGSDVE